ncbi:MAG: putative ABC exporter domain-containing protein [Verrucomicrobiota bacterium]
MSRALTYLWFALLKHKVLHFCRDLRQPTTLIGFAALLSLVGFLFHNRHHEVFAQLVRRESLIGGMLVMLCGSVFKGFLQRGLVFEPPDVEFLFTSPFTQRQIVVYRLLPNYLFALLQGLVFLVLFASHLKHPLLTTACLTFFQIACFHVAAGAAIVAGKLSEQLHHRFQWMMLGVYFLLTALYLRAAWDLKIIPSFASSPLIQLLFYPALTLSDTGTEPPFREWILSVMNTSAFSTHQLWQWALYPGGFAVSAVMSLRLLLKLKANIFETSLATTMRAAEKRFRIQQGRPAAIIAQTSFRSARLPQLALFRGVGAIVWKNLIVALRSKRQLVLAFVFTLIFTAPLAALFWLLNDLVAKGGEASASDVEGFNMGVALFLVSLAFLLQRTFPFDFRCDGHHIVGFRTLPVSPIALVLAEITVPTVLCLAFQALGIAVLMFYARFDWPTMLLMLLGYPAVALGLNAAWNLHYLLSATKSAGGQAQSASAVGTLMVVALSFLIFFPAGWTGVQIGQHVEGKLCVPLAFAGGLVIQYAVDLLLVLTLARVFQRFEVSRDSR